MRYARFNITLPSAHSPTIRGVPNGGITMPQLFPDGGLYLDDYQMDSDVERGLKANRDKQAS